MTGRPQVAPTVLYDKLLDKSEFCYLKRSAAFWEGQTLEGYFRRALRRIGVIKRAIPPPIRAVKSWGQLKVAGRAVSMGALSNH